MLILNNFFYISSLRGVSSKVDILEGTATGRYAVANQEISPGIRKLTHLL